jgi:hypothetical protein
VDLAVIVESKTDLFEVVGTLRPPGRLTGCLHSRYNEGDQHANDGDDDEQLDQGERPKSV